MRKTLERKPGYYGRPLYERQAWQQFGRRRFPSYDRFWQALVIPYISPRAPYIKYIVDIPPEHRRVIGLHQRIFRLFNSVYVGKPRAHEPADWFEGYHFLACLYRLTVICTCFERLLLLLTVSNQTPDYHAAATQIRTYYEATRALDSFHKGPPRTIYDPLPSVSAEDAPTLQKLVGNYDSKRDLIVDLTDRLISAINNMYRDQLVPKVESRVLQWPK